MDGAALGESMVLEDTDINTQIHFVATFEFCLLLYISLQTTRPRPCNPYPTK